MERNVLIHLKNWIKEENRKPFILRGARQVGKSYLARQLGTRFKNFIEVNFEMEPQYKTIFTSNLDPVELVKKISVASGKQIVPGNSLLFFDEIQNCPEALTSLRYFYEKMPDLHVIAAGSLIDFILDDVGVPVGRVRSLYIYPMSFQEFLIALGHKAIWNYLEEHSPHQRMDNIFHEKLLNLLGEYFAVGGMPEAVKEWIKSKNLQRVNHIQNDLVDTYRQDFGKYTSNKKIGHIDKVFTQIPRMIGKKLVFSSIDNNLRARELKPALELLEKAGVVHIIKHSSANGIPLESESNSSKSKVIMMDIGITQSILGLKGSEWIIDPAKTIVNRGQITESFVGQELLAYDNPFIKNRLYYWLREKRASKAEVDYVMARNNKVIPVEVKSGKTGSLKSMRIFLDSKINSKTGLNFSQRNFEIKSKIINYPLYAVKKGTVDNQKYK